MKNFQSVKTIRGVITVLYLVHTRMSQSSWEITLRAHDVQSELVVFHHRHHTLVMDRLIIIPVVIYTMKTLVFRQID